MPPIDPKLMEEIKALHDAVLIPYWSRPDFWFGVFFGIAGLVVGGAGVYFSIKAFREAREAKAAATEAGRTVKIQTVAIELTEISQRLDKLRRDIQFADARDLLTELSRKLRRLISPFQSDPEFTEIINTLRESLSSAKESLNGVRPANPTDPEVPHAVYFAIEGDFATINGYVADLLGLLEKRTIQTDDENEHT